jgi:hypothetical protein
MDSGLSPALLLGALAFAGVGGTLNLGQSNYIKDKGYAMGRYIGRITSPITGQEEPISEIGYHFPATAENQRRWRAWWRAANIEHFFSFFLTCLVCLVSLTLIAYSIFYTSDGERMEGAERFGNNIGFIWGEAEVIGGSIGPSVKLLFLAMGAAILLTTEIGVLDAASRISADIVKVNWFRDHPRVTESRLYYTFLWGTILIGSAILLLGMFGINVGAFALFTMSAALNGLVMFCYCGLLLYLNRSALPPIARIGLLRVAVMVWAVGFFGFFATWLLWEKIRSAISSFGA